LEIAATSRFVGIFISLRPSVFAHAIGALETDKFKRQSAEMAAAWGAEAPLHIENCHHFSMLEELRRPGSLLDLALRTASV